MATDEATMTDAQYDYYEYTYQNFCSEPQIKGKTEEAINEILQIYVFPIILLIGTIGNLISLRCLHQLSINVWSSCLYLNVLCLVDLFVLFVHCGNQWLTKITEKDLSEEIMKMSAAICKIYPFVFQFTLHLAPWILVACSVELMIAAHFPLAIYRMCTRERGKAVMLLITVLLTCLNMHYFWTYGIVFTPKAPSNSRKHCIYIEEFSEFFRDSVLPYLNLIVGDILPLIIISVLFFMTTSTMVRKRHKEMEHEHKKTLEKYFMDIQSLNELKTTFMLVTLFYIIVITLRVINTAVEFLINYGVVEIPCKLQPKVFSVMALIKTILDMTFYCYLSFKFIIYLVTSARFRKELVNSVLSIVFMCQRRDKINLSKNNLATKPLMDARVNSLDQIEQGGHTPPTESTSKITTNV